MDRNCMNGLDAALWALTVLQGVMLGSLYTGVAPHPPTTTPLFGIAPFLAVALTAAVAALVLGGQSRAGRWLSLLAALCAALSFGPQKYFDAQFPLIWPAVIAGQLAIASVLVIVFKHRHTTPDRAT